MKNSISFKKLAVYALAMALLLTGQRVLAHDLFNFQPLEGHGGDINLNINHGCEKKPDYCPEHIIPDG